MEQKSVRGGRAAAGVYDLSQGRKVQWMGDVRNKCDHAGKEEPRAEDVADHIENVAKLTALFIS